jgi:hypothetical protein
MIVHVANEDLLATFGNHLKQADFQVILALLVQTTRCVVFDELKVANMRLFVQN